MRLVNLLRLLRAPANPLDAFKRHLVLADAANAARDWPGAETAYARALGINPLRADVWVQYGHCLKEQDKLDRAEAAYRAAMDLDRRSADSAAHLGEVLKRQGRTTDAIPAFEAALMRDPAAPAPAAELAGLGVDPAPLLAAAPGLLPLRDADDLPLRAFDAATKPAGVSVPRRPKRANVSPPADQAIAFIHLHKTGGLTLHDVLERHFAADRVCPVKDDHLHLYSTAELDTFDFFSGHFDVGALRTLPRRPLRTISVFRRPVDRLISFYRFHSGHDLGARHGVNAFVRMANAMSVEEFFEDERVRNAPEVFNHYLVAFGLTYDQALHDRPLRLDRISDELVAHAEARVVRLDAIGLTERFDDSVRLACETLGYPVPASIKSRNETDSLALKMKGAAPPRVTMTPRLEAALADLVRIDERLYAAAVAEFERRWTARG